MNFHDDILPLKNRLYRLALRITLDAQDAEDVVQDTLLALWDRRERWDEIGNIEVYALTVCRNSALERTRSHAHTHEQLNNISLAEEHTLDERLEQQDTLNRIKTIINTLPEKQRACMQLRDFEGLSYREISTVLSISEEQVKINIHRARNAVKKALAIN